MGKDPKEFDIIQMHFIFFAYLFKILKKSGVDDDASGLFFCNDI